MVASEEEGSLSLAAGFGAQGESLWLGSSKVLFQIGVEGLGGLFSGEASWAWGASLGEGSAQGFGEVLLGVGFCWSDCLGMSLLVLGLGEAVNESV